MPDGVTELHIGFGKPAQTPEIVVDAVAAIRDLKLAGGSLLRIHGPFAIPVAIAIAHEVGHLYGAVACFDPKIAAYVVCVTHNPDYALGQMLPRETGNST